MLRRRSSAALQKQPSTRRPLELIRTTIECERAIWNRHSTRSTQKPPARAPPSKPTRATTFDPELRGARRRGRDRSRKMRPHTSSPYSAFVGHGLAGRSKCAAPRESGDGAWDAREEMRCEFTRRRAHTADRVRGPQRRARTIVILKFEGRRRNDRFDSLFPPPSWTMATSKTREVTRHRKDYERDPPVDRFIT